jgi:hypothetical protein
VTAANPEAGFTVAGFFGMLAIGVVWQLAYAPYVSDYSRYLPKDTGPKQAFWATYLGLVLSSVFVMVLGVLLGAADPANPLGAMGSLLGPFGIVGLLIFAFSAAMINAAELYSGVMCALTAVNSTFRRVVTSRTRVITTLVCGLIANDVWTAILQDPPQGWVRMVSVLVTAILHADRHAQLPRRQRDRVSAGDRLRNPLLDIGIDAGVNGDVIRTCRQHRADPKRTKAPADGNAAVWSERQLLHPGAAHVAGLVFPLAARAILQIHVEVPAARQATACPGRQLMHVVIVFADARSPLGQSLAKAECFVRIQARVKQ